MFLIGSPAVFFLGFSVLQGCGPCFGLLVAPSAPEALPFLRSSLESAPEPIDEWAPLSASGRILSSIDEGRGVSFVDTSMAKPGNDGAAMLVSTRETAGDESANSFVTVASDFGRSFGSGSDFSDSPDARGGAPKSLFSSLGGASSGFGSGSSWEDG